MATDINTINLSGHLGQDADLRFTNSGVGILSFSIANNYTKKVNGEYKEQTNWFTCKIIGSRAEKVAEYFRKGTGISLTGELRQSVYEKDGQKRYSMEVLVDRFIFTGGKGSGSTDNSYPEPQAPVIDESVYDTDIPF